jgi:N6-adenosine-specific RNA methylase IME4
MNMQLVVPERPPAPVIDIGDIQRALAIATDPFEIKEINAKLDAFEQYMHDCGLYSIEDMRPINELRMKARWKLGAALATVERGKPGPVGKDTSAVQKYLKNLLQKIGLDKSVAMEAQRIGTMPDEELEKAYDRARREARLLHYEELIVVARPWWYKANRRARHQAIHTGAAGMHLEHPGPFPLIYADPPWKFEIYSEKGLERTPDQHYPTLTYDEIKDFRIDGRPMSKIAHKDAALLLWCTSSNLHLALDVMDAWNFKFKASAVWVKDRSGLGLIFRNQHEVLLYGTRGKMPGPQVQHPSVFSYPRMEHSAKPPEVRWAIEEMYPDFDETTRLELFAREKVKGWTRYGFEA